MLFYILWAGIFGLAGVFCCGSDIDTVFLVDVSPCSPEYKIITYEGVWYGLCWRAQVQTNALMSAAEVAQGTRYTEALTTSWRPPKHYRDMTEDECDKLREKWSILVDVSYRYSYF